MPRRNNTVERVIDDGVEIPETLEAQSNEEHIGSPESDYEETLHKEGLRIAREMKAKMDSLHLQVKEAKLEIARLVDLRQVIVEGTPIKDQDVNVHRGKTPAELKSEISDLMAELDKTSQLYKNLPEEKRLAMFSNLERKNIEMEIWVEKLKDEIFSENRKLRTRVTQLKEEVEYEQYDSVLKKFTSIFNRNSQKKALRETEEKLEKNEKDLEVIQHIYSGSNWRRSVYKGTSEGVIYEKADQINLEVAEAYGTFAKSEVVSKAAEYTTKVALNEAFKKDKTPDELREFIEKGLDEYLLKAKELGKNYAVHGDLEIAQVSLPHTSFVKSIANNISNPNRNYEVLTESLVQFDFYKSLCEIREEFYDKEERVDAYGTKWYHQKQNSISKYKQVSGVETYPLTKLLSGDGEIPVGSGEIELLCEIKSDSSIKQMFGEALKSMDDLIYRKSLNSTLYTNHELTNLQYYPTPEAIRNMTLFLATNDTPNGQHFAEIVFSELTSRPDWEQKCREAIEVYPEIESAIPLFKKFYNIDTQHSTFQKRKISKLPRAVFVDNFNSESEEENKLAELALRAMNSEDFVKSLCDAELIDSTEQSKLLKALQIIEDANEGYNHVPPIINNIRNAFVKRFSLGTDDDNESLDWVIKSLIMPYVDKLLENSENESSKGELTSTLTQNGMIASIIDNSLENNSNSKNSSYDIFFSDLNKYAPLNRIFDAVGREMMAPPFQDKEGLDYLVEFNKKFKGGTQDIKNVFSNIASGKLDRQWALRIWDEAEDLFDDEVFTFSAYAESLLSSVEAIALARRAKKAYGWNIKSMRTAAGSLNVNTITASQFENLPKLLPALIDTELSDSPKLLPYILSNAEYLIDTKDTVSFTNKAVGIYGNKAESILMGLIECRKEGVVDAKNVEVINEFLEHFRVLSPSTLAGYIEAKKHHQEDLYIAELSAVCEKMTGVKPLSEAERAKPYYKDLIKHVYAMNSSNATNYERNLQCSDRSADLAEYKIKSCYEINLFNAGSVTMKEGTTLDEVRVNDVKEQILSVEKQFSSLGFDKEKMLRDLSEKVNNTFKDRCVDRGIISEDEARSLTREQKMMLVSADILYSPKAGGNAVDVDNLKQLVIQYDFALYEDIREYIAGTSDRVSGAANKDYALLCEMGEFFNDRIKDVHRSIVDKAYSSDTVKKAMRGYFENFSQELKSENRQSKINKMQVDKLGLTDAFIKQIGNTLEKRTGRKYTDAKIKRIISLYEKIGGDFSEKTSTSKNKLTKAFYGQLKSQREKSIAALREITGKDIDPKTIHLGELNIQEALEAEQATISGVYNEDQFASYTAEKMVGMFAPEQAIIASELSKFQSTSGVIGQKLNSYITKTKESANARMVGGVCVAGDNPPAKQNQWDMENYFQMVFQDPESKQCQGLVLLHSTEVPIEEKYEGEDGVIVKKSRQKPKILTASLNPASTYLYTVDEEVLFDGIMKNLEIFAQENGFDKIALSSHENIRTNRRGGNFEKAMDKRVASIKKSFAFSDPQRFSYVHNYHMSDMDIVWERK